MDTSTYQQRLQARRAEWEALRGLFDDDLLDDDVYGPGDDDDDNHVDNTGLTGTDHGRPGRATARRRSVGQQRRADAARSRSAQRWLDHDHRPHQEQRAAQLRLVTSRPG